MQTMRATGRLTRLSLMLSSALLSHATTMDVQRAVCLSTLRHDAEEMLPNICRLHGGADIQHTYAMLKPDVASDPKAVESIKAMIADAGLTILREERSRLSRKQCEEFYAEHKDRDFFNDLVKFMTSGPVLKLELAGKDAIKRWRALLGPTNSIKARTEAPRSVRALFGTDGQNNAAHGSDAPESAARELKLMFATSGR